MNHDSGQNSGRKKTSQEYREAAARYLMSSMQHQYYEEPLVIQRASGEYMYDVEGKKYLDCFSGILVVNAGHCNEEIKEAVLKQAALLQHTSTCYLNAPMVDLAEKLSQITPGTLSQTFLVNSGSEAVDGALILARKYTGREHIISLRHAYHGRSLLANAVTGVGSWRRLNPLLAGIHFGVNPYCYRCYFGRSYPGCDLECVQAVEDLIVETCEGKAAAILMETIQGVGGYIVPPREYFQRVEEIAKKYDILLIMDETQTGFGRVGRMFGIEDWGVVPDIMVMAKGMGNGLPVGAFITTEEIGGAVEAPWLSTFGGNPLSSIAALANIAFIQRHNLAENARTIGGYCLKRLEELKERFPLIGDVRGRGLMIAIELVEDTRKKKPAQEKTTRALQRVMERGLLLGKAGAYNNVLRFGPPLTITKEQLDTALQIIGEVLQEMER